jgi:transcriptional regulator with XRE-family HTH domain
VQNASFIRILHADLPFGGCHEVRAVRHSPTVQRRRLGTELRRLRELAALTIEQVAQTLDCSPSKVSRIETGQVRVTSRDLRTLFELYGVGDRQRAQLLQIADQAREKGWWQAYGEMDFAAHVGFEAAASSFRTYNALVVPGLLQTAEYADGLTRALLPDATPEQIERRLALRRKRQALLDQPNPPALWVILDEAVLRRPVGGRPVAHAQLTRLVEAARRPNITLQVLPFARAAHAGLDGSFNIMTFPDPSDPDIVYLEHATSPLLLEGAAELARYALVFDHLQAAALPPEGSVRFLEALLRKP